MRTASVFTPRSTSQQSNGAGTAPTAFCRKPIDAASSSSTTATNPPTTSEWPPRYLVVECTTTSAPSSSGRCRYGVANVLSTTQRALLSCAYSATAAMSTMASNGLVGDSTQTSRVVACHAAASAAGSSRSTASNCTPIGANTSCTSRHVPP